MDGFSIWDKWFKLACLFGHRQIEDMKNPLQQELETFERLKDQIRGVGELLYQTHPAALQ
jgi:hypothetical protein